MKLPGNEDFLVRMSSSLDGSNWILSKSGRLLLQDGEEASLKLFLGDFLLSSVGASEASSLMHRVERSIFSPTIIFYSIKIFRINDKFLAFIGYSVNVISIKHPFYFFCVFLLNFSRKRRRSQPTICRKASLSWTRPARKS